MAESGNTEKALATFTHARLRAAQGDFERAAELLREVLARNPGDDRARALLTRLADRRSPRSARLERWLARIARQGPV